MSETERRPRALLLPWVVLAVALGTLVADAMTPRDLSLGEDEPVWNANPDLLAFLLMRVATAVVLCASALAVTVAVIRRGFPRAGLSVWLGYMAFVISCFVLPGFTGRVPGFDLRLLYPPIVFTAAYFAWPVSTERLATLCRVALGPFVYGSLAAAVINPAQALAGNYQGMIPWLDFRLYGIGGGATSLGVESAVFLTIELVSPSRSRWRWLNLAAGTAALFLTQAKTSWLFVLAVVAYQLLRSLRRRLAPLWIGSGASARVLKVLAVSCGAVVLAGLAAYQLAQVDVRALRGGENLATLTGRSYIWATSLRAWLDDPVFGYGLGLWEGDFRARYAPLIPHAHNQFLHSLASAGVIGLLGLLAYLWAALRAALQAARTTPIPLVLLAGVLAQCLTNVPLRGYYLLEPLVVVHLLLFAALVNGEKLKRVCDPGPGDSVTRNAARVTGVTPTPSASSTRP
jgi:exopolysaccharide production protein ExoQ